MGTLFLSSVHFHYTHVNNYLNTFWGMVIPDMNPFQAL